MVFWRWIGYNTIIYLAGLQGIPNELYEAADIDGATIRQKIQFITVPMLRPIIILLVFTSTIGALQLFTERSEEHTSELQSRGHLVCRLLLEKKKAEYIELE